MNSDNDYNRYGEDDRGVDSYNYRPSNRRPRRPRTAKNSDLTVRLQQFYHRYPIWCTLGLIALATVVFVWVLMLFTDVWTHHGAKTTVPSIKGMQYQEALDVLDGADLTAVIADSIHDEKQRGGTVVEVWPKAGATVKSGREVYLTIVAYSPRMVVIDMPLTDISQKQAENYLAAHGISSVQVHYVPAEFDNNVVSAKVNGKLITMGSRIPSNSTVILEVGQVVDSLNTAIDVQIDSIIGSDVSDVVTEPAEPMQDYE